MNRVNVLNTQLKHESPGKQKFRQKSVTRPPICANTGFTFVHSVSYKVFSGTLVLLNGSTVRKGRVVDREFIVQLNITAASCERLYRGEARTVMAHDAQGRRVRFPAAALRRFVTHQGISGVFVLRVDARNKLLDIRRC